MSWLYGAVKTVFRYERFGFITRDEAKEPDIFFHVSDLCSSKYPEKGDCVRYRVRWSSRKEKDHAIDVQLLHEFEPEPKAVHRHSVDPSSRAADSLYLRRFWLASC